MSRSVPICGISIVMMPAEEILVTVAFPRSTPTLANSTVSAEFTVIPLSNRYRVLTATVVSENAARGETLKI